MAKKKDEKPMSPADAPPRTDRHKPRNMVALSSRLYRQLRALAERNRRPLSWELSRILEAALAAEDLWPPPEGD